MKGAGPGDKCGARPSRGRVPADPGSVPGEMLVATAQTGAESLWGLLGQVSRRQRCPCCCLLPKSVLTNGREANCL